MKITLHTFYITCFFLCLFAGSSYAQGNANTLSSPPANLTVDGDLKEWGDSLRFKNPDGKITYTLANDTGNLYLAVRFTDKKEQMHILFAGLTLSVDMKGRKKETFSMTFPAADPNETPKLPTATDNSIQPQDQDEMMQARLTKLRSIRVSGFKDVESEIMTTANTYGFKAAINLDADGFLVYEAAIPMRFFHAGDLLKEEWAFNLKVNGIGKPKTEGDGGMGGSGMGGGGMGGGGRGGMGGGGGRGGMGGGGRGGNRGQAGGSSSDATKSTDFWTKLYLAK